TPALAHQSISDKVPAIMVTGSHIPFDRNGLKFYRPDGEITKEKGIEPIFKYEFNHPDTALNFIRQGLGIALLPELTLKATTG
ncbi:hypothetical protein ONJ45_27985, partial [Salmonella enterica subsp. enterica serovar Virginia]|nr:hypothetical protein [Salmonella enterica subsp. enterica serovar Virginia]